MYTQFDDRPIISCSSGTGSNVAISLIRISGLENFGPIEPFFSIDLQSIESRKSYLTKIQNNFKDNEVLDEAVITIYRAPNSYTGETVIELGVHGNRLNVERIISTLCEIKEANLRRSYGGEFTHRALKNGKLNISQVEGLDLLLNAQNLFSLKQGFSLLDGNLQDELLNLQSTYLHHRSCLELGIDFAEDIGEEKAREALDTSFATLKNCVYTLHNRSQGQVDLTKVQVALFGPPNAGKSTLFNTMLASDRSIVSEVKGTTRDYISESIKIGEDYFELIDTAGIRETEDKIEELGVERSLSFLKKAFYKILLLNPLEDNQQFLEKYNNIQEFDAILTTHSDLAGFDSACKELMTSHPNLAKWSHRTNLTSKEGAETAKSLINIKILDKYQKLIEAEPISLDRHKQIICEIFDQTEQYTDILESETDVAIISSELHILGYKIEELLGVVSPDEVLKNIFSNFCIGK